MHGSASGLRALASTACALALVGCVDLTEPWKQGGAGGSGGGAVSDGRPMVDEAVASSGGAEVGAGIQTMDAGQGTGGVGMALDSGTGGIDASGPLDATGPADVPLGGSGGAGGMGGSSGGVMDVGAGDGGNGRDTIGAGGAGGFAADAPRNDDVALAGDVPTDAVPATADAYVPPALPTGLVAYYPCDEVVGTVLPDMSGNHHDGTLLVAPMDGGTSGGYQLEGGKVGRALRLIQSGGGYASLPVDIFRGRADITLTTWVRLNSLTTWQRLFDIGINANLTQNQATGTVYLTFFLEDFSNKLGLSSTTDGYQTSKAISASAFSTKDWKHVAVVFSGGVATLYLDAVSAGQSTMLGPKDLGAIDYAFIGKSQFADDPLLDARIDELRVYDHALTATEIQTIMQFSGS